MPRKKKGQPVTQPEPVEGDAPELEEPTEEDAEGDPEALEFGDPEEDPDAEGNEPEGDGGETEVEPEPEPGDPSFDELYAEATTLRVKGRGKMGYAELKAAVEAAREGFVEPEDLEPEVRDPDAAARPPEQVTQQQALEIRAAKLEALEGVLGDPNLPAHLRTFIEAEVAQRLRYQSEAAAKLALKGPVERFLVTQGGRYTTREGYTTELVTGSVITPNTHDLLHVRQQGIVFQACGEPVVAFDELGRQHTRVTL